MFLKFIERGGSVMKLNERFETVIDLMEARKADVVEVLSLLDDIDYAVCGGVAVAYWVIGRKPTVRELDLLVYPQDIDEIGERLREIGCSVGGYGGIDIATVAVKCGGLNVDLLGATEPWEEEAIERAVRAGDLKIVRPEYLIMMKLRSEREKDLEDIVLLLSKVDFEKVRRMVRIYMGDYYVEELEQLKEISNELGLGKKFSAMRMRKFLDR
jgi:hypothetical protein